jgi:hypothetical protein
LIEKPKGKRTVGRSRRRWKDNINVNQLIVGVLFARGKEEGKGEKRKKSKKGK